MTYSNLRTLPALFILALIAAPVSAGTFNGPPSGKSEASTDRPDRRDADTKRDSGDRQRDTTRDSGPRDSDRGRGGFDRDRSRDKDVSRDSGPRDGGGRGGFDRSDRRDDRTDRADKSRDTSPGETRTPDIFDRSDRTGSFDGKDRFEARQNNRQDSRRERDGADRKRDWNSQSSDLWAGKDRRSDWDKRNWDKKNNDGRDKRGRNDDRRHSDRNWGGGWNWSFYGHHRKQKDAIFRGPWEPAPGYKMPRSNEIAYLENIIAQNEAEIDRAYRLLRTARDGNMRAYLKQSIAARLQQNAALQDRIDDLRA